MRKLVDTQIDHISKREHPLGRWLPALLYSANYMLWVVAVLEARAWDLLWLALFPIPAVALYVLCIRRKRYGA